MARIATTYLSAKLNTEIKIEKFSITGYKSISLENFLIKDLNNDTLVYTGQLNTSVSGHLFNTDPGKLQKLTIENADIRLVKLKENEDNNLQFIIDFFSRKDRSEDKTGPPVTTTDSIAETGQQEMALNLEQIEIINSRFRYRNEHKTRITPGVNFTDIELQQLNLKASNLQFLDDTFSVHVNSASVYEKSGFDVDSLTCDFKLSPVLLQAENLKASTPLNNLDLDFRFDFESFKDFKDFINKVKVTTSIRPSLVNLTEVGYFAPVMFNMDNRLRIAAKIRGTVANFKARDLKIGIGKATQFRGNIQMNGLPNITETYTHLSIKDFITTVEDASSFRLPTDDVYIDLPEMLARFGKVRINGKFTGFYNDFVSYANFKTGIGELDTDILLRVNQENTIEYNGHLAANDFNAGRFFNVENNIKELDLTANINGFGTSFETMEVVMDGTIDSLNFFQNIYNEIEISGRLEKQKFSGEMAVKDENVSLDFNGSLDYGGSIPSYDFTADIRDAYLARINLVDAHESSRISTRLEINFMGDEIDNTQGIIIVDSTKYSERGKDYSMDELTLSITRDESEYSFIRLYSDIVDATLEGKSTLYQLPNNLKLLFNQYFDTLVCNTTFQVDQIHEQDFIFTVHLKNTSSISELFVPDLLVAEGTKFSGGYNSQIDNLFFDGTAPEITYKGSIFKDWFVEYFILDNSMQLFTGANTVHYSDTLKSDSLLVHIQARNDSVEFKTNWTDLSRIPFSKGNLSGIFVLFSNENFELSFDKADIDFSNTFWAINPGNRIQIDTGTVFLENFGLTSIDQAINFEGKLSTLPSDTLFMGFHNFDLSNFDLLLKTINIDLDGKLNGDIKLIDYYKSAFYLSNLRVDDLYFNREKLGSAGITTIWDSKAKAFDITGNVVYTGNIGKDTTLSINGQYFPDKTENNFDLVIDLNKYKITTLEPFTRAFSSDIEGMASGKLFVTGSNEKPDLTGSINLMRSSMFIDYLNVKYYFFADNVKFDKNRIHFSDIAVNDSLNNQALASGSIYHDHLTDFDLDININTNNLLGLNTTHSMNDIYYGAGLASGNVSIYGPVENLTMAIGVRSERGTNIKIPVSYDTEVGSNEYIVFVGAEEEEVVQEKEENIVDMGGLTLNLDMNITNDADIQLFMPYNMGNLKTRGNGELKINVNPAGEYSMEGEYIIDRGSFFFTLQNIINRNFDISRDSKIVWTGDPYDAQINMSAVYKVKTYLGEYGPPDEDSTRVPVDCIIELRNSLLNPDIYFQVDFPDLKDNTKQFVYSRLDTTDQAEMSRQMISLLVLNSFYRQEGFNGSVGFNTFDLVTNQLNSWLSQISNDFDIGVNYRPGNEISSQEVEVALSTQLFDDRVLIDGNVGMRGNETTSQNTNNIVGEVTVEVKITKDGRFRAKAFNKSNNNYLYKNYSPYTQGVGVFYTQEFDKIGDILRSKKKEKEEVKKEQEQNADNGNTVKK